VCHKARLFDDQGVGYLEEEEVAMIKGMGLAGIQ